MADTQQKQSGYRYNWFMFFAYIIFFVLVYYIFCPVLILKYISLITGGITTLDAYPEYAKVWFGITDYIGFANWKIIEINNESRTVAFSLGLSWLALMIWAYVSSSKMFGKKDKSDGSEHGSARFMTDDEFDKLYPNYQFRPNEQEFIRSSENYRLDIQDNPDEEIEQLLELDFSKEVK